MPIRKLDNPQEAWNYEKESPCLDPDHNIPMHMVLEPGRYEHKCSKCGRITIFTVDGPSWLTIKESNDNNNINFSDLTVDSSNNIQGEKNE